jgi:predicted NBD/HSP70 family sugar kinase
LTAAATWHLGIDVGGSSVRMLGERRDGVRGDVASAPAPDSYDAFLELVATLLLQAVDGPLAAVACGLPGTSHDGRARFVPALPWLEGRPVADDLARTLAAPVQLAVDGHLALLAEAVDGGARGRRSAVLVAVGTGIGGAVMTGGRIWRGYHGSAGSWGWLPAEYGDDGPQHGQFERVASGSALSAAAGRLAPPRSARELVELARLGDPAAVAEVERYGRRLGRGLAAIASIIDPEVVLLGGGLSSAMDILSSVLEQCVRSHASPDGQQVPVLPAEHGPEAGVLGALRLAQRGEGAWL